MARGISVFWNYTHTSSPPGFHTYGCTECSFTVRLPARGPGANALARAAKGKAAIRKHRIEKHSAPLAASEEESR